MSNSRNFLSPSGAWSNVESYSARLISAPTFDGVLLISCPLVTYSNSSYYCTLDQNPTAGVTPSTSGSGWTLLDSSSSFPPAVRVQGSITCAIQGDLSIFYLLRYIDYTVTGRMCTINASFQSGTFVHTTASGGVFISGAPAAVLTTNETASGYAVVTGFDWATNTTTNQLIAVVNDNSGNIYLFKNVGALLQNVTIDDLPTGTNQIIYLSISYPIA